MFALTTILLSSLLFQISWGNVIVYDQGFTFHLETQDDSCDQGEHAKSIHIRLVIRIS